MKNIINEKNLEKHLFEKKIEESFSDETSFELEPLHKGKKIEII